MVQELISTISPTTGEVVSEVEGTSIEEAISIVNRSRDAFKQYSLLALPERKRVLGKAMALIQERKSELGSLLTTQMGRPIRYSEMEVETMGKRADYLFKLSEVAMQDLPGVPEDGFGRFVRRQPRGVTLVIFAWNFPYLIAVISLLPALLAGNTVILKPSPQTPLIGEAIVKIFNEAGLPKDVLQIIQTGLPSVLDGIVKLPDINQITFTGSTAAGLALQQSTAGRLVPLNLELGGNDPAYVCADADIAATAASLADGAVFNSGQSCCAIERIYVHEAVYNQFVSEVQSCLKEYVLGDPRDYETTVGPVVSKAAKINILDQISDALERGARDVTPSNQSFETPPATGNFIAPTILVNVDHFMKVMKEETFGPVIPIMRVANDKEAVDLMNDSNYGLTASVWTKDIPHGEAIIEQLEAGTVFINRCDYPSPDLAWTGWKDSGLGCTLGPCAFDAYTKLQSFHIKKNA